ncbi:MAG TPA: hypothetical protein VEC37_13940 [Bacillota bacterium]|nr:hypothetical protein [Bacillota bacterium]
MKIDVQEELKRFKPWVGGEAANRTGDSGNVLAAVMGQFRDLKKADLKLIAEVQRLGEELKSFIKNQNIGGPTPPELVNRQEQVLFAIYDQVENSLKVAVVNQNEIHSVVYRQLLEYIKTLFAMELNWVPVQALGEQYNPYDFDGFATAKRDNFRDKRPRKLEIVNELRTGFRCQGQIIRKPMVEFYE